MDHFRSQIEDIRNSTATALSPIAPLMRDVHLLSKDIEGSESVHLRASHPINNALLSNTYLATKRLHCRTSTIIFELLNILLVTSNVVLAVLNNDFITLILKSSS